MPEPGPGTTERGNPRSDDSGQALLEYAISVLVMCILAFGVVDFTRAIYQQQVITNLTGQGANLASRGTALAASASAVVSAADLNISTYGKVIVSSVYNNSGSVKVTAQVTQGSLTATSKIGSVGGVAALPTGAVPPASQTVYVTEVYYKYQPITPIGKLVQAALPVQLYDVAYY